MTPAGSVSQPSVLSMILSIVKDTYVEALIIAIAMVFYMRLAKLCEPWVWRTLGYKTADSGGAQSAPNDAKDGMVPSGPRSRDFSRRVTVEAKSEINAFFASLIGDSPAKSFKEIVETYDRLVYTERADLSEKSVDKACAVLAFPAIAEAIVQVASSSAKAHLTRLLSDMRTFGFTRSRELYSGMMKALVNKHFTQDMLWLNDVMVSDGVAADRTMSVCLLNAAVSLNQDQKALKFFRDVCKAGNPSMRTYMTVLRVHTKNQDWRGALALVDGLQRSGGEPDALVLNTVLGICVGAGHLDAAEKLVARCRSQADTVSFNILLKGHAKNGDNERAEQLFAGMLTRGPKPNIITFNTMMDCSVRCMQEHASGSLDEAPPTQGSSAGTRRAWQLLDQMDALGLQPDRYTCSTLVKGMHVSGCTDKDIDRALALIKRIDLTTPVKADDGNSRLMEVVFNSLLDVCSNIRDLDRMAEIVDIMQSCKVVVSAVTFGTLMKAFGHAGQLTACHEVWRNMRKASVRPTIVTYGCYIDACIRNSDVERAQEVFSAMSEDGVSPNAVVYTTMIRGLAQAKQPLKALELYRRMRNEGIEPTAVTFNSVLDIIARQLADTESSKLQEVINDMRKADVTPDAVTYSILIKASCNTGHVSSAIVLFRQLRKHGVLFDEVAFNTLLLACSKEEKVAEAEELFFQMLEENIAPTLVTISILVKLYGKAKMLDKAINVAKMMESKYNTKPNLYLYTCLIQACVRNRQVRKSWQVFGQMFLSGVLPDAIAYGTAIHGCVYHSKFEEAMAFVRHAYVASPLEAQQSKGLAQMLEIPAATLPQQPRPMVLQTEVLRALSKALRRKGQTALLAELDAIAFSEKTKDMSSRASASTQASTRSFTMDNEPSMLSEDCDFDVNFE